jgi:hypothetical protein
VKCLRFGLHEVRRHVLYEVGGAERVVAPVGRDHV